MTGIDLTHNPEFWTCEFYATYFTLEDLIRTTEDLLALLSRDKLLRPFPRLDFITALETKLGEPLPRLEATDAQARLLDRFRKHQIEPPSSLSLPNLLDKLSSTLLEPQCVEPTWIINHPECLSPLSKSFAHASNGSAVAARGELFINKQEMVNTYEEENSPTEQRRKFEMQQRLKDAVEDQDCVDESYLHALEYGMPPTGGWGCGLERLCMYLGGTSRIADTLAFGTLRNVVSLSHRAS